MVFISLFFDLTENRLEMIFSILLVLFALISVIMVINLIYLRKKYKINFLKERIDFKRDTILWEKDVMH